MKLLLTMTAVVEAAGGGAGDARIVHVAPASAPLDTQIGLTVGRVAGVALIALGIACWRARGDDSNRAATGIVAAMLFYNVAGAAILASAGLSEGLVGLLLWPAVILHAVLAGWCLACLQPKDQRSA